MIIDTLKDAGPPLTGTEIHTLTNGAKIVLNAQKDIPAVAVHAWARCGAINEKPEISGISHALEHMVFKGTPRLSAAEVSKTIEGLGGNINAATGLETTHYYLETPAAGADKALDTLLDAVLNPTFPEEELNRENKVIVEEIHRRNDSPEAALWDAFMPLVFSGTPYETNVIGTEKTVMSLRREDLLAYHKEFYVPANLVFVVTGDFNKDVALRKIKNAVEPLEKRAAPETGQVNLKEWTAKTEETRRPAQRLSYVALGLPVGGYADKNAVAWELLAQVLAGGVSSRFYQELREETQNAHEISCDLIAFHQKGIFSFFIDALPEKRKKALDQLFALLKNLKTNPITEEEVQRAKTQLKSSWTYFLETPRGQAHMLGVFGTLGRLDLLPRYLPDLDALSAADLMALFEKDVLDKRFSVLSVVPDK